MIEWKSAVRPKTTRHGSITGSIRAEEMIRMMEVEVISIYYDSSRQVVSSKLLRFGAVSKVTFEFCSKADSGVDIECVGQAIKGNVMVVMTDQVSGQPLLHFGYSTHDGFRPFRIVTDLKIEASVPGVLTASASSMGDFELHDRGPSWWV